MQKELQPHQVRVITEKSELDEKLSKLGSFLDSSMFDKLNIVERGQLHRQYKVMGDYSRILEERIALF